MTIITKPIALIDNIFQKPTLHNLQQQCAILDKLNYCLYRILPTYLKKICHIGSFDCSSQELVIFVTQQESKHIIHSWHSLIIKQIQQEYPKYNFTKLIIKVSTWHYNNDKQQIMKKTLSPLEREKLAKSASLITT